MNPLAKIIRLIITFYQKLLSPLLGTRCRYFPSCSAYAYECFEKHSLLIASKKTILRILRCSPLHAGGVDFP